MADSEEEIESNRMPEPSWHLKQTLPEIRALLDLLQCSICYEPIKNPVMAAKCSHNFCSLCIRKYLLYKQQCPGCFEEMGDSDLKPNKRLTELSESIARLIPRYRLSELISFSARILIKITFSG